MKVICLIENTEGLSGCPAEHGLSLYIETGAHRLLMDAGADDLILENARRLNVDLRIVDTVILSHGHYDHGGGLPAFLSVNQKASVLARPSVFDAYYSLHSDGPHYIGLPEELKGSDRFSLIDGDTVIADGISVFSDIPVLTPVPSANVRLRKLCNDRFAVDDFAHEQCLVIEENGKRYLFSGCAHHGIRNILAAFQNRYGSYPDALFSGFHMMKRHYSQDDLLAIMETASFLRETGTICYTGHCTGETAYHAMKKILKQQLCYLHCGDTVILPAS